MISKMLKRALMALTVVCLAGAMAPQSAQAAGMKHGEIFGKWMANCPNTPDGKTLACRLVQVEQRMAKNGKTVKVMRATIVPMPKGDNLMLVPLPLGYTISAGVKLAVDNAKKGYKMFPQRCLPQGCELAVPMTKALVAEMKKGNTAKIHFLMGNRGAHIDIPLSGLTKALAKF